ncbi:MAG UNVERIFIED_CONTAM: anion permease [Planctomycetaceae bacterium]|jgi:sodium-dependent dicarboxylate transporter 2/3/5
MALTIVRLIGVRPRRLVIGFGCATFGLSMWISNTATTMLMLPIATALLKVLDEQGEPGGQGGPVVGDRRGVQPLAVPLLLVLAWASTLGGMATPVGSPTNSVAIGIYRRQLPDAPDVYFSDWFLACGPIALAYLAVVLFSLTWRLPSAGAADTRLGEELSARMRALGRMSAAELRMLLIFVGTAVLWVFREPLVIGDVRLFSGWQTWYAKCAAWCLSDPGLAQSLAVRGAISDATVAVLMAVLMFVLPSGVGGSGSGSGGGRQRSEPLMNWETAVRLPWDMILLFGGGFRLASAFESTGLATWLAGVLQGPLSHQPPWLTVAIICLILVMLTELTSNVATVNAILPAAAGTGCSTATGSANAFHPGDAGGQCRLYASGGNAAKCHRLQHRSNSSPGDGSPWLSAESCCSAAAHRRHMAADSTDSGNSLTDLAARV